MLFEINKFNPKNPSHLPEQRRIAEILSAADRKLERRRKEKLERVKRVKNGFVTDLVSGMKRAKMEII